MTHQRQRAAAAQQSASWLHCDLLKQMLDSHVRLCSCGPFIACTLHMTSPLALLKLLLQSQPLRNTWTIPECVGVGRCCQPGWSRAEVRTESRVEGGGEKTSDSPPSASSQGGARGQTQSVFQRRMSSVSWRMETETTDESGKVLIRSLFFRIKCVNH